MAEKIFVLGFPGSGKSTAVRQIESLARINYWLPIKFNDYDILREMYRRDDGEKFSPAPHGGFDVHDHQVFDVALQQLEKRVHNRPTEQDERNLIIIEFSRNDYQRAFKLFSPGFLHNALFLFIDADVKVCIERIQRRTVNPVYPDEHYVSEYIFESYYYKDDRQEALTMLKDFYGINSRGATTVSTSSQKSLQAFCDEVVFFVTPLLQKKLPESKCQ